MKLKEAILRKEALVSHETIKRIQMERAYANAKPAYEVPADKDLATDAEMEQIAGKTFMAKRKAQQAASVKYAGNPAKYQQWQRSNNMVGSSAEKARQTANLNPKQMAAMKNLQGGAQNAGTAAMRAYIAKAREEGKPINQETMTAAKQAMAEASSAHVKQSFGGPMKALFQGMDHAEALKRYGTYNQYVQNQGQTGYNAPVNQGDARYIAGAYQETQEMPGLRTAGRAMGERFGADAASKQIQQGFTPQFSKEVQNAPEMYKNERNAQVGNFFKNNWGKMAGLGMGAMGLMMMSRMGNKGGAGGATAGAPQNPQQQVDWTAQSNYGHGGHQTAGTQAQTVHGAQKPTNMFTNFMGKMTS